MILYIAEKPSLGRAIAAVLPKPHKRQDGCIIAGNNQVVSWCIGHLLEQAEPEAYDPAYKQWRQQHLPIVPEDWKLRPKKETRSQLGVLKKLIKEADTLVHAGDPDREGQLLVDEVLHYMGVKGKKLNSVKRCLISNLNPAAVQTSLQNMRDNTEFKPLSASALARSRADWLYGINMTRAYTLQGQKVGYKGVLSVGRVQTPVLGLVVRRDIEIRDFVAKPFYEVQANLRTSAGETFKAKWSPSKACEPYLDEQKRNLSRALAENVVKRISFKPATVKKIERKKRILPPPLPYNLSSLQMDANRAFGLSAQQVLDACQALYERHTLITYPRSDSRHLPVDHFKEAATIVDAVQTNLKNLDHNKFEPAGQLIDTSRKSKAWNNAKVDAHHAIIPTLKRVTNLNQAELNVYSLVCRQYLAQFLPDHEFFETRADIIIEEGLFIARAREAAVTGWKVLFPTAPSASPKTTNATTNARQQPATDSADSMLPSLKEGQNLESLQGLLIEKKTTPPAHFTDATLLAAMTGIARFVQDDSLKKVLRETDGLGTEATRAGIIELLFRRQFLERQGKTIRATAAGLGLVNALPESATLPDMTARWESLLTAISQRESGYNDLMDPLTIQLNELIDQSQQSLPESLRGLIGAGTGPGSVNRKKKSNRGRKPGRGKKKGVTSRSR